MDAAGRGHADVAKLLLDKGADVNAKTGKGKTALMMAAENGHADIVHALLGKGADVNAKTSNGWTALLLANDAIEKGIWTDDASYIPLTPEVKEKCKEVVRILKVAGAQ